MTRILIFCAHPIEDAGCRYRIYQFLSHLRYAGFECVVRPFSTDRLFRAMRLRGRWFTKVSQTLFCTLRRLLQLPFVWRYDIVVIHREVFPFFIPLFEKLVTLCHPHVLFSFDDAVHLGHHSRESLNHPFLYRIKYGGGINQVLRDSELVIAGNQILAEHARTFTSKVVIVPTVIDCDQYRYQVPRAAVKFTIGWVGSRSTVPYLREIEPILRRVSQCYPGQVQFHFVGYPEYQPDLPGVASFAFELGTEQAHLRTFDIGLMPMPDTEWTRGKCAFKAIQYMALGIPTVASPVGATIDLIQHGKNGLLACTPEEWFGALRLLMEDLDLRRRLAQAARQTIEEHYSLQVWGPKFAQLFERTKINSKSLVAKGVQTN